MFYAEIDDVATLYNELAFYIKDNTQDDYFDFEILTTEAIIQKLQIIINDPMKKVYVAIEKDKIIGFISGEIIDCFLPISQKKKVGYISGAYVSADFRGKGIMKKLEQMLIKFFQKNGITYVELNVLSKNCIAKNCWGKMHYSTFREQMRKKISE